MNCYSHSATPAVGMCRCGKAVCSECATAVAGRVYCRDCVAALTPASQRKTNKVAVAGLAWAGIGLVFTINAFEGHGLGDSFLLTALSFLVPEVVALVSAVVALVQIRRAKGRQRGFAIAVIAIVVVALPLLWILYNLLFFTHP